jgi:hypothetical protein
MYQAGALIKQQCLVKTNRAGGRGRVINPPPDEQRVNASSPSHTRVTGG